MTRIGTPGHLPVIGTSKADEAPAERRDRPGRDPFRDPGRDPRQDARAFGNPFGGRQEGFGTAKDPSARREGNAGTAKGAARGEARDGQRIPGEGTSPFQRVLDERLEDRARDRLGGDAGSEGYTFGERRDEDARKAPSRDRAEGSDGAILAVVQAGVEAHILAEPIPIAAAAALPAESRHAVMLAERIGDALRSERLALARAEGSFRLVGEETAGGPAHGLDAITVSFSGTALDVTLVHAFDATPEAMRQAAAGLAHALGSLFPGRRVRVLEEARPVAGARDTREDDALPGGGLADIGHWLARG